MSTTGSRHAERREVPKVSAHFLFFNSQMSTQYWPKQLYVQQRKNCKDRLSVSSVSDSELCSPEEKKVKEVSVSESRFLV